MYLLLHNVSYKSRSQDPDNDYRDQDQRPKYEEEYPDCVRIKYDVGYSWEPGRDLAPEVHQYDGDIHYNKYPLKGPHQLCCPIREVGPDIAAELTVDKVLQQGENAGCQEEKQYV